MRRINRRWANLNMRIFAKLMTRKGAPASANTSIVAMVWLIAAWRGLLPILARSQFLTSMHLARRCGRHRAGPSFTGSFFEPVNPIFLNQCRHQLGGSLDHQVPVNCSMRHGRHCSHTARDRARHAAVG